MANNIDWSLIIILAISGLLFTSIVILAAGHDTRKTREKFAGQLHEIKTFWSHTSDDDLIKAAVDNIEKYPRYAQSVIEAESKKRGLWEKILSSSDELAENKDFRESYVCEKCQGTVANLYTGRCSACEYPIINFGYCTICDKFFSTPPGRFCPWDNIVLIERKAASDSTRIENMVLDFIILGISAFISFSFIRFLWLYHKISLYSYFYEMKPLHKFFLVMGYIFLYYFIFELIWQRTPGKFLTGTKVIDFNGRKPDIITIFQRTLIRFVPFEPFSFLGKKAYGWHDNWSGTYVIKARRFGGKTFEANTTSGTRINFEKEADEN